MRAARLGTISLRTDRPFQGCWKPCYTHTVAWVAVGARYSRQEAFPEVARHAGKQCSIGFQPVSAFGVETGLNSDGPFGERTIQNLPLSSRHSSPGLNGAKLRRLWDDDCPKLDFNIQFRVSTLIIVHIGRILSDYESGNHSRYFQGVARCEPRHRLEADAMLHYTVAWMAVGARYSRQEAFPEIARHAGKQCSIGFQPVSGFGVETGLNSDRPFGERTIQNLPLSSRHSHPVPTFLVPTVNVKEDDHRGYYFRIIARRKLIFFIEAADFRRLC
jgi:hypothetical protein